MRLEKGQAKDKPYPASEVDDFWTAGQTVFRRPEVLASIASQRDLHLEKDEKDDLKHWVLEQAFDLRRATSRANRFRDGASGKPSTDESSSTRDHGTSGESRARNRLLRVRVLVCVGIAVRRMRNRFLRGRRVSRLGNAIRRVSQSPARRTAILVGTSTLCLACALLVFFWAIVPSVVLLYVAARYPGEKSPREALINGRESEADISSREFREFDDEWTAAREVIARYGAEPLQYFWRLLSDQPNFLSRADERAVVLVDGITLETRLNYRMTDGTSPKVLIPLMQNWKGALVSQLNIKAGNASGAELSAYETRGLVALCVDLLVSFAFARSRDTPTPQEPSPDVVDKLIHFVCRPRAPQRRAGRHECDDSHVRRSSCQENCGPACANTCDDELCTLIRPLELGAWTKVVDDFCDSLARSEFVVVEVDRPGATIPRTEGTLRSDWATMFDRTAGDRDAAKLVTEERGGMQLELVYTQLLAYESRPGRKLSRYRLGLVQDTVTSPPLVYAVRAQSYHFQIAPISDKYVFDHRIYLASSQLPVDDKMRGPLEIRFLAEGTRSHTHCYITALREPRRQEIEDFVCVVHYREVPPGALGGAAIVSLGPAIVLPIVTVFSENLVRFGEKGVDLSAPILTLSSFIVLMSGHWFAAGKIPRSSVSAYLSMLTTMFLGAATFLTWLLDRGGLLNWADYKTSRGELPYAIPVNWIWVSLTVVALTQTVYLWLRHRQAVKFYRRRQDALLEGELDPTVDPAAKLVAAQSTARRAPFWGDAEID
jgi:hypothetical protein